jgi:prefoldin subunit 5
MDYLQAEAEALKEQLDAIQTRIADLEEPSES